MNVVDTDAVAFLQKPSNEPHVSLHVTAVSPLYAKYNTSVDAAPAANIMYVNTYKQNFSIWEKEFELLYYGIIHKHNSQTWRQLTSKHSDSESCMSGHTDPSTLQFQPWCCEFESPREGKKVGAPRRGLRKTGN